MTDEVWASIPGFEGSYSISTLGRVRSEPRVVMRKNGRTISIPERVLKASVRSNGYLMVELWADNHPTGRTVHSLMAEAFLPRPDGAEVVRHLNDDKLDLRLENLSWGTHSENQHDKVANGHHHYASRTRCANDHEFTEENTMPREGGGRRCRTCHNQRGREAKRLKRQAARLEKSK